MELRNIWDADREGQVTARRFHCQAMNVIRRWFRFDPNWIDAVTTSAVCAGCRLAPIQLGRCSCPPLLVTWLLFHSATGQQRRRVIIFKQQRATEVNLTSHQPCIRRPFRTRFSFNESVERGILLSNSQFLCDGRAPKRRPRKINWTAKENWKRSGPSISFVNVNIAERMSSISKVTHLWSIKVLPCQWADNSPTAP